VDIHATGNSRLTHLLRGHQAQHVAADNGYSSSVISITLMDIKWPSTIDPQTAVSSSLWCCMLLGWGDAL